ncbi:hypothetical protein [Flavobacterium sp. 3HN19-14]|uniref:hypothetical protein n=1 Tax=Flavobacterium sp. 3HN19-14 TaxID=3448133 RepID=UPI003EDEED7F
MIFIILLYTILRERLLTIAEQNTLELPVKHIGEYELQGKNIVQTVAPVYDPIPEVRTLSPQTYGISKELTVDADALEVFVDNYIIKGSAAGCISGKIYPSASDDGCYETCQQCADHFQSLHYTGAANGRPAYIAQKLHDNAELNQLASMPGGTSTPEYGALVTMLTQSYGREWDLLLEACLKPCAPTVILQARAATSFR